MTPPDAWDECGTCGHDYDDHDTRRGCDAAKPNGFGCPCTGFQEPAS